MACFNPLQGYRARSINPKSGKRGIVFNTDDGFIDQPVQVPCGQCIGCRLERSRQWAIRCVHEAKLHEQNCFITLTFNDENLPHNKSLDVSVFQKFMKRLRRYYGANRIRFFHCGEYGERFQRPHYHACLFGFDFPDKKLWREGTSPLYTSETLNKLWGFGYCIIGAVTFESAAYVARYIVKKVTGEKAQDHYMDIDYNTGEILNERKPEYITMSRRPGIAHGWYEKHKNDVFPQDHVVLRGVEMRPPKYYDHQYEIENPNDFKALKNKRKNKAKKFAENNSSDRLIVRERVTTLKLKKLKRGYEDV